MFGSPVLDIMIGLFFIYLMLSILCSSINELLARIFDMRATTLADGIKKLLADTAIGAQLPEKFYQHPLIQTLAQGKDKPSYIPAKNFALALLDTLEEISAAKTGATPSPEKKTIDDLRATIAGLPDSEMKKSLSMLIGHAGESLDEARKNIEDWFNSSMERVSGLYKRKAHTIILLIAFLVSVGWNADSVFIAQNILQNPTLRSSLVAAAEEQTKQTLATPNTDPKKTIEEVVQMSETLKLPIGWSDARWPVSVLGYLSKFFGLVVTALALSLGAPFWFDMLNKVINLRSSGKPPDVQPAKP
jgi:hypothetical protein